MRELLIAAYGWFLPVTSALWEVQRGGLRVQAPPGVLVTVGFAFICPSKVSCAPPRGVWNVIGSWDSQVNVHVKGRDLVQRGRLWGVASLPDGASSSTQRRPTQTNSSRERWQTMTWQDPFSKIKHKKGWRCSPMRRPWVWFIVLHTQKKNFAWCFKWLSFEWPLEWKKHITCEVVFLVCGPQAGHTWVTIKDLTKYRKIGYLDASYFMFCMCPESIPLYSV